MSSFLDRSDMGLGASHYRNAKRKYHQVRRTHRFEFFEMHGEAANAPHLSVLVHLKECCHIPIDNRSYRLLRTSEWYDDDATSEMQHLRKKVDVHLKGLVFNGKESVSVQILYQFQMRSRLSKNARMYLYLAFRDSITSTAISTIEAGWSCPPKMIRNTRAIMTSYARLINHLLRGCETETVVNKVDKIFATSNKVY